MREYMKTPHESLWSRLCRNRYEPGSHWVSFADILLNAKEILYCWLHRVPPGSSLEWRGRKIVGHRTRRQRG